MFASQHWLRAAGPPAAVFLASLLVLLRTLVPDVYTLDSGEFVVAAEQLGIVHAPGYPLYLLALHLFLKLPLGTPGYVGNLFSALCLACSAPLVCALLRTLKLDGWAAAGAALLFVWSYHVWLVGLFAEVYAPQILTLALAGWALARLATSAPQQRRPFLTGALFGLAVAVCPPSALFAPGAAALYLALRLRWTVCLGAAALAAALFLLSLLYFPLRFAARPDFNLAGEYDARGVFQPVDLGSAAGVAWMVTGRQFSGLFFVEGLLPSPGQIAETAGLFARSSLGLGAALGLTGLLALYRRRKAWLALWAAFFIPYTYFYTTYGAGDKMVMFGPSFLVWAIAMGFGLDWLGARLDRRFSGPLRLALALLPLLAFMPLLDLSGETGVRQRSEAALQNLPAEALVFGNWHDIVPLQYLQSIDGLRPDVRLYNLFLFPNEPLAAYLETVLGAGRSVVFVHSRLEESRLPTAQWRWALARYPARIVTLDTPDPPFDLFFLGGQP